MLHEIRVKLILILILCAQFHDGTDAIKSITVSFKWDLSILLHQSQASISILQDHHHNHHHYPLLVKHLPPLASLPDVSHRTPSTERTLPHHYCAQQQLCCIVWQILCRIRFIWRHYLHVSVSKELGKQNSGAWISPSQHTASSAPDQADEGNVLTLSVMQTFGNNPRKNSAFGQHRKHEQHLAFTVRDLLQCSDDWLWLWWWLEKVS